MTCIGRSSYIVTRRATLQVQWGKLFESARVTNTETFLQIVMHHHSGAYLADRRTRGVLVLSSRIVRLVGHRRMAALLAELAHSQDQV